MIKVGIDWGDRASLSCAVAIEKRADGTMLVLAEKCPIGPGADDVRYEDGALVEYRKGSRLVDATATPKDERERPPQRKDRT